MEVRVPGDVVISLVRFVLFGDLLLVVLGNEEDLLLVVVVLNV